MVNMNGYANNEVPVKMAIEPQEAVQAPVKLILVTGGVMSGVGKGIVSSSLGVLLKSDGYRVTAIKIDPYINVDAGTFSPFEHGFFNFKNSEKILENFNKFKNNKKIRSFRKKKSKINKKTHRKKIKK